MADVTINAEVTKSSTDTTTDNLEIVTGGTLTIGGGVTYTVTGTFTLTDGNLVLAPTGVLDVSVNGLTMNGGTLSGSGTIMGNLAQSGGTLAPS